MNISSRRAVLVAAALALLVLPVAAQAPQGERIRATIDKVDGDVLSLKTREGGALTVRLAPDTRISALVKASLADIRSDSFIGVAGMPRPDGSIAAFSVHIFMPSQRGVVADRHGPWDGRPGSTMTNAYVADEVKSTDGDILTVKYRDGEKKIVVTPATVIAAIAPGSAADLKPGAGVVVFAAEPQPDGTVTARSISVGRDVAPAM
ncbi:hypothetical protein RA307_14485 [Xanthobacteraceae bacterium Astr-EGSB]|uniref:hypothetical protein n=1 Tax=Astrobacterium formosum TaxID=3069710 RepID=UPI0027B5B407|nr:hypothetical protein [Xanthobacteraceae bacterium Astr-EGSB]